MSLVEQHHEPKAGVKPLEYGEMHVASPSTQFLVNINRLFKMYWRRCAGRGLGQQLPQGPSADLLVGIGNLRKAGPRMSCGCLAS